MTVVWEALKQLQHSDSKERAPFTWPHLITSKTDLCAHLCTTSTSSVANLQPESHFQQVFRAAPTMQSVRFNQLETQSIEEMASQIRPTDFWMPQKNTIVIPEAVIYIFLD